MTNQASHPQAAQDPYLIALTVTGELDIFIKPVYKQIIVHSLNLFIEKRGLAVYGWCLMTNHLYLVARAKEGFSMLAVEEEFKQFTSQKIFEALRAEADPKNSFLLRMFETTGNFFKPARKIDLWDQCDDMLPLDDQVPGDLADHIENIHYWPVKNKVVDFASDYTYSSAKDYAGIPGLVNVTKLDFVEQQIARTENIKRTFYN